jgi:hypothetical protein
LPTFKRRDRVNDAVGRNFDKGSSFGLGPESLYEELFEGRPAFRHHHAI